MSMLQSNWLLLRIERLKKKMESLPMGLRNFCKSGTVYALTLQIWTLKFSAALAWTSSKPKAIVRVPIKVELIPGLLSADELVGLIPVVESNLLGPEIDVVLLLGLFRLEVVMLLEVIVAEALDSDFKDSSFG